MPIYEYECKKHGRFEILVKSYRDKPETAQCTEFDVEGKQCVNFCYQVTHRVSMQPDDMWGGHYVESLGRVISSKSELKRATKERGIVNGKEQPKQLSKLERAQKAVDANSKKRREAIAETLKHF